MKALSYHYGQQVYDLFEEGIVTRWWSDPYSRGSYSHLPLGLSSNVPALCSLCTNQLCV